MFIEIILNNTNEKLKNLIFSLFGNNTQYIKKFDRINNMKGPQSILPYEIDIF